MQVVGHATVCWSGWIGWQHQNSVHFAEHVLNFWMLQGTKQQCACHMFFLYQKHTRWKIFFDDINIVYASGFVFHAHHS